MAFEAGTCLGRYEIRSLLGAGGMGEVYLAREVRLDRPVALKVLPAEVASDQQRLHRFLQEARAASKLSGQHAAHIYDIDEQDGTHFIAMEYVEGEPLDRTLASRTLEVAEVVRIGIQIAEALDEAHAKGVTHRDIKPANIHLTPRGQVKVLDFGLAKLEQRTGPDSGAPSSSELATQIKTNPGTVMGTVAYMSPEQALGEADIDHRTDIFSLGVVLYEMATGRVPFRGDSTGKTINSIVNQQPEAMARFNYNVPAELDVIVRKALRKKRDERYQTVRDLLVDLRSLKEELDFAAQRERSVAPNAWAGAGGATGMTTGPSRGSSGDEHPTAILRRDQTSSADADFLAHTAPGARHDTDPSAARPLDGAPRRRRFVIPAVAAGAVIAIIAAVALLWMRFGGEGEQQRGVPGASSRQMKIAPLPNTGKAVSAVISPDGKYVVHIVEDGDRQSLRLRQVSAPGDVEIVPPSADHYYIGTTFSPDSNFLYFVRGERGSNFKELHQVSAFGGPARKLVRDVDSPVSFSPDGRRMAFMRVFPLEKEVSIFVVNEDGTNEQRLYKRNHPFGIKDVAWSPDGSTIACTLFGTDAEGYYANVIGVAVEGGAERVISSARWRNIADLAWLPDMSGLLVVARDRTSAPSTPQQIWFVPAAGGAPRRVTNDLSPYHGISLTKDAETLLAVSVKQQAPIWVAPGSDAARARQITSNREEGHGGFDWTPDGRIVYASNMSGHSKLWVMDADGANTKQLTTGTDADLWPSVSPDGRFVVFETNRSVGWSVWRMNADGTNPIELIQNVRQHSSPQFSPDSRWVYYEAPDDAGRRILWRVATDGGAPERVTDRELFAAHLSPDGSQLLYLYRETPEASEKIGIVAVEGGAPVRGFDPPRDAYNVRWVADGRGLHYVKDENGVSNLWRMSPEGRPPHTRLTDFKSDRIYWYDWSRDGRTLAVSRGDYSHDVVLIKDFK